MSLNYERPDSAQAWQEREEQMERRNDKRLQGQLFDELTYRVEPAKTAEEREVEQYYARPQACDCHHTLGMHDWPMGKCMETACACVNFRKVA